VGWNLLVAHEEDEGADVVAGGPFPVAEQDLVDEEGGSPSPHSEILERLISGFPGSGRERC